MAILVLAGVLSVPSAVFAEANWYGSLRSGLEVSDGNTKVVDIGSRWGIKGSAEAGEGLTAVYRFEHKPQYTAGCKYARTLVVLGYRRTFRWISVP